MRPLRHHLQLGGFLPSSQASEKPPVPRTPPAIKSHTAVRKRFERGLVHTHQREAMDNGWLVSGFNDHPEQVPVMVYGKGLVLLDNMGGFTLCS